MPNAKKISRALGGTALPKADGAKGFLEDIQVGNISGDASRYDRVKGTAPAGLIRKAKVGDVLQQRYYGDDYDAVVDAAQDAALQGRPSHFNATNYPRQAMQDEIVMLRPKHERDMGDSAAFAMRQAGTGANLDALRKYMSKTGADEDLLRGAESHEIGHLIDRRNPKFGSSQGNVLEDLDSSAIIDLGNKLGYQGVDRLAYAASYPELLANIAQHKRNVYAQHGLDGLPMDRDGVTRMFNEMGDYHANPDNLDLDVPEDALPWDSFGDDPVSEYGPSAGRQLKGAAEVDANLGNIWHHANDEEKAMMVEDFLRSADNFDIRKSLLARTA